MEKLKAIFKKLVNKETILYVVFGVLTTLVNFVAFKLFTMVFDKLISSQLGVHISNVLAWIFAVAFAYVTNKLFVFESMLNVPDCRYHPCQFLWLQTCPVIRSLHLLVQRKMFLYDRCPQRNCSNWYFNADRMI